MIFSLPLLSALIYDVGDGIEIVSYVKRKMMRACFLLKIRPEKMDQYKARHSQVWPEMLEALRECGWRNYSLFLQPSGLVVGYVETEDFASCREAMKNHPINARWQSEMAPFFESSNGHGADDLILPLEEVFHLD